MEDKIAAFVKKKRTIKDTKSVEIKEVKTPWYRRPILREAFIIKIGIDKKFYLQHEEWSSRVWVGPYDTEKKANEIIDSYVTESLKGSLERKPMDSVHSIIVENGKDFFKS